MSLFARFAAWATLAFVLAWFIHPAYQRGIGAIAGLLAAPRGSHVEWVDLETFFPFDLSVYAALCLASAWTPWRRRLRAMALGGGVLVLVEIVTLTLSMRALIAASRMGQSPETERLVTALLRLVGLVTAAGAWLVLLGWQRVGPLVTAASDGGRRPRRTR